MIGRYDLRKLSGIQAVNDLESLGPYLWDSRNEHLKMLCDRLLLSVRNKMVID